MNLAQEILSAFRPKTLTAAVVPCIAGTALAVALNGPVALQILVYALISALFIQVGTNLVNDAMDFKKGADTEERIGPRRITQSRVLSFRQVMALASLSFLLAIVAGIPLVMHGGWPIVLIGLISVLMGYAYTSGPYPLAYVGLGEVFVFLFFGLVAVGGMFYLQSGAISLDALVLGAQIGLHASVLIAINNLRDSSTDVKAGKRTLAVRFGVRATKFMISVFCLLPFLLNFYWLSKYPIAVGLSTVALIPAIRLVISIWKTPPSPQYNRFLAMGAGLHLLFGVLLSVGLWGFS